MRPLSWLTLGILPLYDCIQPRLQKRRADKEARQAPQASGRDDGARREHLATGPSAQGAAEPTPQVDVVFSSPSGREPHKDLRPAPLAPSAGPNLQRQAIVPELATNKTAAL